MTNLWTDKNSDRNQEEDDNNVSQIAFTNSLIYIDNSTARKTTEFVMIDCIKNFVATNAKTAV